MIQNRFFVVFLFIFSFSLSGWAYDEIEISKAEDLLKSTQAPLANLEGEPSATVHNCVNVLTGDFFDIQTDVVLPGPEPLVLERFYCSSDHRNGLLFNGWSHNLGGSLIEQKSSNH